MAVKFQLKKKAIENGIADLKKSLEGTDLKDIKKNTEFNTSFNEIR